MSKQERFVLGVDCGGTKCEAVLVQPDGVVVGWGHCDVHDRQCRGLGGRHAATVHAAIRRAISHQTVSRLKVLSAGNQLTPNGILPPEIKIPRTLFQVSESRPILALTKESAGVVALAGTGAHVSGRNRAGLFVSLDGLGPYLGDFGGAFFIGLQAIRAAMMSSWHPRHRSSMTNTIYRACRELAGNPRRFSLIGFVLGHPDRWKIASLARHVDEEANRGDRVAVRILEHSAECMAEVVFDVVEFLHLRHSSLTLIGIGSVATRSRIFWQQLCAAVADFAPRLRPARLGLPPAACFALDALCEPAAADREKIKANLFASIREFIPSVEEPLIYAPPASRRARRRPVRASVGKRIILQTPEVRTWSR